MQQIHPNLKRVVRTTSADFEQAKCELCGKSVSDDRCLRRQARYCSQKCNLKAIYLRHKGLPVDGTYVWMPSKARRPDGGSETSAGRAKVK